MASILTPENVVRRIAAECTFIDERGAVGIRLRPAAAIVRQYGEQFRPARRKQNRRAKAAAVAVIWPRGSRSKSKEAGVVGYLRRSMQARRTRGAATRNILTEGAHERCIRQVGR
jgi:hypothetical protein